MSQASPLPQDGPSALQQIRQSAQALLAEGKVDETWELLFAALAAVLSRNKDLELLVAKLRRAQLRSSSERIDPAQLTLLFEELLKQVGPDTEIDPEAEDRADAELDREIDEAEQSAPAKRKRRKRTAGWKTRGVQQDGAELYETEIDKAVSRRFGGVFDREVADRALDQHLQGAGTEHALRLSPTDRDRIFNLGYFTWVEQQGVSLAAFERRRSQSFWRDLRSAIPVWDNLIRTFNEETGVTPSA